MEQEMNFPLNKIAHTICIINSHKDIKSTCDILLEKSITEEISTNEHINMIKEHFNKNQIEDIESNLILDKLKTIKQ
jgi:hypothetical protein